MDSATTPRLNLPAPAATVPHEQRQHDQQEQRGYAGAAFGIAAFLTVATLTLEPILPYGALNIARLIAASFAARAAFETLRQL